MTCRYSDTNYGGIMKIQRDDFNGVCEINIMTGAVNPTIKAELDFNEDPPKITYCVIERYGGNIIKSNDFNNVINIVNKLREE